MSRDIVKESKLAEQVLTNEAYIAAVDFVRYDIRSSWESETDVSVRESLWHEQRALERIERRLQEVMQTGKAFMERNKT